MAESRSRSRSLSRGREAPPARVAETGREESPARVAETVREESPQSDRSKFAMDHRVVDLQQAIQKEERRIEQWLAVVKSCKRIIADAPAYDVAYYEEHLESHIVNAYGGAIRASDELNRLKDELSVLCAESELDSP